MKIKDQLSDSDLHRSMESHGINFSIEVWISDHSCLRNDGKNWSELNWKRNKSCDGISLTIQLIYQLNSQKCTKVLFRIYEMPQFICSGSTYKPTYQPTKLIGSSAYHCAGWLLSTVNDIQSLQLGSIPCRDYREPDRKGNVTWYLRNWDVE